MFWASRTFAADEWYDVQDRFEEQWMEAGEPADMMLVYADTPDFRTRVLIGAPDAAFFGAHPGFEPVGEPDLPKRPKLLMGDAVSFRRHFPGAS
jgi:hypothetical protein